MKISKRRPSPALVVSMISLFVALSGTALALEANEIKSKHIKNGQVKLADLAANAVDSTKIADGTVTGGDLAPDSVGSAAVAADSLGGADVGENTLAIGGDLTGNVANAQIGANAVAGAEVAANALGGADIDETSLDGLEGLDLFADTCDPADASFIDCGGGITVTVDRPMQVLVTFLSHYETPGATGTGNCGVALNNALTGTVPVGDPISDTTTATVWGAGANITDVVDLPAGSHLFQMGCNQSAGDIVFRGMRLSVVELSVD